MARQTERQFVRTAEKTSGIAAEKKFMHSARLGKEKFVEDEIQQYTKSNLKLGQQKHFSYKEGLADDITTFKEFRLPSGKRIDFLDAANGKIYELKLLIRELLNWEKIIENV
jgi:hypothetical protein